MKDRNCSLPRDGGEACFVGVDVSSKQLDVGVLPGDEVQKFTNDSQGINELVKHLKARNVELIVMEATGGYEVDVAVALNAAGLPIVVVNPRHVRDFARSLGILVKVALTACMRRLLTILNTMIARETPWRESAV